MLMSKSFNLILRSNSCPLSSVSNTFTEPELSLFSRILLLFKFIFLPLAHICHFVSHFTLVCA